VVLGGAEAKQAVQREGEEGFGCENVPAGRSGKWGEAVCWCW